MRRTQSRKKQQGSAHRRRIVLLSCGSLSAACALLMAHALFGRAMTPQFAPVGMKWIAAGEFDMGSDEPMFPDAQPIYRVSVDGFWIDEAEVTNAQFDEW